LRLWFRRKRIEQGGLLLADEDIFVVADETNARWILAVVDLDAVALPKKFLRGEEAALVACHVGRNAQKNF
jgi:hypothetical protein